MKPVALLVTLALGAGSVACQTLGRAGTDLSDLQESVEAYNDAYRWKNYQRAALFLPNDMRAAFLATYEEDDKSLHVEDYQVLRADLLSEKSARVLVRTRFMQLPSVTLETKNLIQHWALVGERWILETEENSIREIDPTKLPAELDTFGGGPEPAADLEVEVTGPDGQVLRKDGDPEPDPAAPPPP